MKRPDRCSSCGESTTAHTGTYCQECGEPLTQEYLQRQREEDEKDLAPRVKRPA